jgi:hypothetical protein
MRPLSVQSLYSAVHGLGVAEELQELAKRATGCGEDARDGWGCVLA